MISDNYQKKRYYRASAYMETQNTAKKEHIEYLELFYIATFGLYTLVERDRNNNFTQIPNNR